MSAHVTSYYVWCSLFADFKCLLDLLLLWSGSQALRLLQVPSMDAAENCHPAYPAVSCWRQVFPVCMRPGQHVLFAQPCWEYRRPEESACGNAARQRISLRAKEAVSSQSAVSVSADTECRCADLFRGSCVGHMCQSHQQ